MSKIKPLASKTYGGGGKVLSVILAGTLALGMTPAAALSQAALDVTPAYATGSQPGSSAENPLPIKDWNGFADGGVYKDYTVTIEEDGITKDPRLEELSYTVPAQKISTTDFSVVVKATPNSGDPVFLSITSEMFNIKAVPNNGSPDSSQPAQTWDLVNAGTYTVTLSSAGANNPDFTLGDTTEVTVNKAKISADLLRKAVVNPQVGIDKPADLAAASIKKLEDSGVSVAATDEKIADLVKYTYSTKASSYDKSSGTYIKVGNINVAADLVSNAIKTNYKIEGETTFPTMVQANTENYTLTFGTTAPNKVVTGQAASKTVDFKKDGTALDPAQSVAVTVSKTRAGLDGEIVEAIAITDKAYDLTWTPKADTGTPALPEDPNSVPALPGLYEATAQVGGDDGNLATGKLSLTVAGDLGTVGVLNSGATVSYAGKPVPQEGIKLVETDKPEEVEAQIKAAIESGVLKVTFATDGDQKVDVPAEFLDVSVASASSGAAVIQASPAANDAYRGGFNLNFEFGKALPEVETDLGAKPWMGNAGYAIANLVSFGEESDAPAVDEDYTLAAFSVDAEGKATPVGGNTLTAVGNYKIVATPMGEYAGAPVVFAFAIEPYQIEVGKNAELTGWTGAIVSGSAQNPSVEFTGKAIDLLPVYKVTFADKSTESFTAVKAGTPEAADAQVVASFKNNTDAGTAAVDVAFQNNLAGSDEKGFEITVAPLGKVEGTAPTILATDKKPTADDIEPVVVRNGVTLVEGKDYTVGDITKVGATTSEGVTTYTFKIIGMGNFTGEATTEGMFKTTTKNIAELWGIAVAEGTYVYKPGEEVKAPVTIKTLGQETADILDNSTDGNDNVALTYSENTAAGTATVTARGIGDYAGTLTATYQIDPLELSDASNVDGSVKLGGADDLVYTGKQQVPRVLTDSTITPVNEGYEGDAISYTDFWDEMTAAPESDESGINAGTSYLVLTPTTGNFVGSVKVPYEIAPAELTADNVSVEGSVAPGAPVSDAVKVTFGDAILAADVDYTVDPEDELPGKATMTVTGKGNFSGTVTKDIEVLYDLSGVQFKVADTTYNGKPQTPTVTEAYYMKGGEKVAVPAEAYAQAADSYVDAGDYTAKFSGNEAAGWTGKGEASFV
ncbi:hypothetical protein, partial [Xiamenia xianingshaonis]